MKDFGVGVFVMFCFITSSILMGKLVNYVLDLNVPIELEWLVGIVGWLFLIFSWAIGRIINEEVR